MNNLNINTSSSNHEESARNSLLGNENIPRKGHERSLSAPAQATILEKFRTSISRYCQSDETEMERKYSYLSDESPMKEIMEDEENLVSFFYSSNSVNLPIEEEYQTETQKETVQDLLYNGKPQPLSKFIKRIVEEGRFSTFDDLIEQAVKNSEHLQLVTDAFEILVNNAYESKPFGQSGIRALIDHIFPAVNLDKIKKGTSESLYRETHAINVVISAVRAVGESKSDPVKAKYDKWTNQLLGSARTKLAGLQQVFKTVQAEHNQSSGFLAKFNTTNFVIPKNITFKEFKQVMKEFREETLKDKKLKEGEIYHDNLKIYFATFANGIKNSLINPATLQQFILFPETYFDTELKENEKKLFRRCVEQIVAKNNEAEIDQVFRYACRLAPEIRDSLMSVFSVLDLTKNLVNPQLKQKTMEHDKKALNGVQNELQKVIAEKRRLEEKFLQLKNTTFASQLEGRKCIGQYLTEKSDLLKKEALLNNRENLYMLRKKCFEGRCICNGDLENFNYEIPSQVSAIVDQENVVLMRSLEWNPKIKICLAGGSESLVKLINELVSEDQMSTVDQLLEYALASGSKLVDRLQTAFQKGLKKNIFGKSLIKDFGKLVGHVYENNGLSDIKNLTNLELKNRIQKVEFIKNLVDNIEEGTYLEVQEKCPDLEKMRSQLEVRLLTNFENLIISSYKDEFSEKLLKSSLTQSIHDVAQFAVHDNDGVRKLFKLVNQFIEKDSKYINVWQLVVRELGEFIPEHLLRSSIDSLSPIAISQNERKAFEDMITLGVAGGINGSVRSVKIITKLLLDKAIKEGDTRVFEKVVNFVYEEPSLSILNELERHLFAKKVNYEQMQNIIKFVSESTGDKVVNFMQRVLDSN